MEEAIYIKPVRRQRTTGDREYHCTFICPANMVLTGRCHKGDENGSTWYEYASLQAFDENGNPVEGIITVENIRWEIGFGENTNKGFDALDNRVLVGRAHNGDEEGTTRYVTGIIKFNGIPTKTYNRYSSKSIKESSNIWCVSDESSIMTGRHHSGDENGSTYYNFSRVCVLIKHPYEKAPEGTVIVPSIKNESQLIRQSSLYFLCPENTILTGYVHKSDENGSTQLEYSFLAAEAPNGRLIEGEITVRNVKWSTPESESSGKLFEAPEGTVIVGIQHSGDENGATSYAYGEVFFNDYPTTIIKKHISAPVQESKNIWFRADNGFALIGRHHYGDENGFTYYSMGKISCDTKEEVVEDNDIIIHVKMHPNENWFPMSPTDFIRLSRLRKHIEGGSDLCYNKKDKTFHENNDVTPEYFNIPYEVLSECHLSGKYELMPLRPRDNTSYGKYGFFLQPFAHLYGDFHPNGNVPVIKYQDGYTTEYWLFFGYNAAPFGNHEGDWECVKVNWDKDKHVISSVWLSQHDSGALYYPEDVNVKYGDKPEITVYCAVGSHGFYNAPGTYPRTVFGLTFNDKTSDGGYDWEITRRVDFLIDEQAIWKYFAGAWGEVGEFSWTTGPLGPWQKSSAIDLQVKSHHNPTPKELISSGSYLAILDSDSLQSMSLKENSGEEATFRIQDSSGYLVLHSRLHSGDENGDTICNFCKLKVIDENGESKNDYSITIEDEMWSNWHQQSDSANFFMASDINDEHAQSRVLIGRQHQGDENGQTRYFTGTVKCNGKYAKVVPYPDADLFLAESQGRFALPKDNLVIIGIKHVGDENGVSTYCQGYILIEP